MIASKRKPELLCVKDRKILKYQMHTFVEEVLLAVSVSASLSNCSRVGSGSARCLLHGPHVWNCGASWDAT